MKYDSEWIQRVVKNYLLLERAFGPERAILHNTIVEYVNRAFCPTEVTESGWRDLDGRAFRLAYARAGLCCCDNGIYLPASPEDIKFCEDYLMAKIRGTGRRIARIRREFPEYGPYRNQLVLPGLEEPDAEPGEDEDDHE